jgi:hypothetical protein
MPNADMPFGFRPIRYRSGIPYAGGANKYFVRAGDATALFVGDPVVLENGQSDALGIPCVIRATAGNANLIVGVVIGVDQVEGMAPPTLENKHRVASTATYVWVADDPNLIFEVQADNGAAVTTAHPSGFANFAQGAGGSTFTGRSSAVVGMASYHATQRRQLRILRMSQKGANAIGNFTVLEVMINNHQLAWNLGT